MELRSAPVRRNATYFARIRPSALLSCGPVTILARHLDSLPLGADKICLQVEVVVQPDLTRVNFPFRQCREFWMTALEVHD
jgi:hypothetical protein